MGIIPTYKSRYNVYLIQRLLKNLEMGGGGSKPKGNMRVPGRGYHGGALPTAKQMFRDFDLDYSDFDYSDYDYSDDYSDDFYDDYSDDYSDFDYSDFDFSDDESDEEQDVQDLVDLLTYIESQMEEDGALCAKIKGMASKAKEQAMAKAAELKKKAEEAAKAAAAQAQAAVTKAANQAQAAVKKATGGKDEEN